MKIIVIVLGILSVVLLATLRIYVIWWKKQQFKPLSEETKRHIRIHSIISGSFKTCVTLFFIALIAWGIMWEWSNADLRVFVM
jgi:hypothetical protein